MFAERARVQGFLARSEALAAGDLKRARRNGSLRLESSVVGVGSACLQS